MEMSMAPKGHGVIGYFDVSKLIYLTHKPKFIPYIILIFTLFSSFSSSVSYGETVILSWNPNAEPDLAGYRIYYGNSSRNYDYVFDVGDVTEYQLGLSFEDTYYFAVTAYDTSGNESDFSAEAILGAIVEIVDTYTSDYSMLPKTQFRPGTNIRYWVKFMVDGHPNRLYGVVVRGIAFSLYKPEGINCEWIDRFDNPEWKGRKLYGSQSTRVWWDRQIPTDATPNTQAMVRFILRLYDYDEGTQTWNLLGTYYGRRRFNIVW